MNIENEIFKRSSVSFDKLKAYGFRKDKDEYLYEKEFLNDFKAIISIDKSGNVFGKVIDLQVNEEYTNIRTDMSGDFVSKVRDEYKNILKDIRNNCFDNKLFIYEQSNRLAKYIKDKYNNDPEFLWEKFPGYAVFRNKNNNKWYGIITNIDLSKIDNGNGEVEIINIKLDKLKIEELLSKKGFYKAYHSNKDKWISIILNDTVKDKELFNLIDESYNIIDSESKR